jgi:dTDP-4-dehydrorhamnose 3,5-epimerase
MIIKTFDLAGPMLLQAQPIGDSRGYFFEAYNEQWFQANVANYSFVQDNQSLSRQVGTIRGLHYQEDPFAQGKLMRCLAGSIFDVAVDIRGGSPTFGRWIGVRLTGDDLDQFWIPPGFAHGFCTLAPNTIVAYKVTNYYSKPHDKGIAFDDPDIGIEWPIDLSQATISDRDRMQPHLYTLA